ncbi:MAG: hypothetical protein DRG78_05905 [Epsilonproteobacteria bacterium]|nr:MAG: hypothetical protein DRG78_05905 [Campylobacterota bacterium]
MINNDSLTRAYDKVLALLSFIAIIYSIYSLLTDTGSIGLYLGTIILSSIILFLTSSILMLNRLHENRS